jgi:flagellar hook-basal body complex protein FliE
VNNIDTTRLLLEMRAMALRAQQAPEAAAGMAAGAAAVGAPRFGDAVKAAVSQVNAMQQNAQSMVTAFEAGEPGTDLTRVMLEVQKAGLAFRAMTEVRNKLVSAYQEIMNMPV